MTTELEFDQYAEDYDAALAEGLAITGEDKAYFAHGRISWLAQCLRKLDVHPSSAMDFGCGTGSATPYLLDLLQVESVVGVDVSPKSLDVARQTWNSDRSRFVLMSEYQSSDAVDLVFCNGVFHHIPVDERHAALQFIHGSLKPGGLFAIWENNPWNPGTRYIMSRTPFDRDAITLSPTETRRLLRGANFEILGMDFLFIFPRILSWMRGVEPLVSKLPFGAQYQVICVKR